MKKDFKGNVLTYHCEIQGDTCTPPERCSQTCKKSGGSWSWSGAGPPECECASPIKKLDPDDKTLGKIGNIEDGTAITWSCEELGGKLSKSTVSCTDQIRQTSSGDFCCPGQWMMDGGNATAKAIAASWKETRGTLGCNRVSGMWQCTKDPSWSGCLELGSFVSACLLLVCCIGFFSYRCFCKKNDRSFSRLSAGHISAGREVDNNSHRMSEAVDTRLSFASQMHQRIGRAERSRARGRGANRASAHTVKTGSGTFHTGNGSAFLTDRSFTTGDSAEGLGAPLFATDQGIGRGSDFERQDSGEAYSKPKNARGGKRGGGRSATSSGRSVATSSGRLGGGGAKDPTMIDFRDIELLGKIGMGASGVVFEGRFKGQSCAVKRLNLMLNEQTGKEYLAEVKLLTEIRHPNVVLFYGVSFDDSTNDCYILTEYCKNGCLQDVLLDLEREITDAQKLQMVVDVAIGMRFLHASNLMHRDLKSANVLVAGRLELKICDFGISRRIDATEMTGSIGTIPWTAPEMLQGDSYTEKIDVYSFGILLWEITMRQRPYHGIMGPKIIMSVLGGMRPALPLEGDAHYIPGLSDLMENCWAAEPSRRPAFESILVTAEGLLRGSTGAPRPSSTDTARSGGPQQPATQSQRSLSGDDNPALYTYMCDDLPE